MRAQSQSRVQVVGREEDARRLAARLSRAGIAATVDDGRSGVELFVALEGEELPPLRERAELILAIGSPAGPLFAAGADDVVPAGEPELLFRRVVALLEHRALLARARRSDERAKAFEEAMAEVAHDVRSPLHGALGHAGLLAKDDTLTEDQRTSAAAIVRQAERALQLAERVLASAVRSQRVPLRIRPIDVAEMLETVEGAARATAKERGVKLTISPPPERLRLRADGELLSRLLDNLIANALKHTPRGGEIEVEARRAGPTSLRLSVRDSGDGIAPEELHKLTAGLGAGRGLRICREIAERHGGDLWAESKLHRGTRFIVELPLLTVSTRPRVLLVSDDGRWTRDVALALRHACDVRTSTTADASLAGRRPDLVMVESPAPGEERKLAHLRTEAEDAKVPVVELPQDVAAAKLASALARLAS